MPPRARASAKKAPESTVDDDQGAPGQSNVDGQDEPEALPLKDSGAIETPGLEIVPASRRYRATHAFNDWRDGEERDVPLGDAYTAGLVAGGFLIQVD